MLLRLYSDKDSLNRMSYGRPAAEVEATSVQADEPVEEEEKTFVDYPMLSKQTFLVKPPETVILESTPPVLETLSLPASPAENSAHARQQEQQLKPWYMKIKPSSNWFRRAKPADAPVEGNNEMWAETSDTTPLVPAENPTYTEPRLLDLMQRHEPIPVLIRAGAILPRLLDDGISLDDFYKHGYSVRDLRMLIDKYENLLQFGLTKYHITGSWNLDHFCNLYDKTKARVCLDLNFQAADFIRVNVTPKQMVEIGIDAGTLKKILNIDFATLYAMDMRFDEFARTFGLTVESLEALQLNEVQKKALSAHRGWTPAAVKRRFGLTFDELDSMWFSLDID